MVARAHAVKAALLMLGATAESIGAEARGQGDEQCKNTNGVPAPRYRQEFRIILP